MVFLAVVLISPMYNSTLNEGRNQPLPALLEMRIGGSEALVGEAAYQAGVGGGAVGAAAAGAGDRVGEVDQADVVAFPDGAVLAVSRRRDGHQAVIGALLLLDNAPRQRPLGIEPVGLEAAGNGEVTHAGSIAYCFVEGTATGNAQV